VPPVVVVCRSQERLPPESQLYTAKYALRLEFGQESGGKLPGKLYLCLPDESKSCVAGTFTAEVEPDYLAFTPVDVLSIVRRLAD